MSLSTVAPQRCGHTPSKPWRGMVRVGFTDGDRAVLYRCPACAATTVVGRCIAVTRSGGQCRNGIINDGPLCARHNFLAVSK